MYLRKYLDTYEGKANFAKDFQLYGPYFLCTVFTNLFNTPTKTCLVFTVYKWIFRATNIITQTDFIAGFHDQEND